MESPDGPGTSAEGIGPFYVESKGLWTKPFVCIINADVISTGDGMAWGCTKAGAETVGFTGTSGSFAMAGGQIWMPGNVMFTFPFGTSVDKDGTTQLDSDASGEGG